MDKGIYFGGRKIVKPGAYALVNANAMTPNRPGAANTIGVIGTALGGVPQTIKTINSPIEADQQLRGGTLLDVIRLMYDPSPEVPGAGEIKYYRLNLATQSQLNLQDATPSNVILVKSRDYGVWTQQIRIKVEAGTTAGKKVSINDVQVPAVVEVGDNLGPAFKIQYVGSLFAARMTITKTGDNATQLKIQTQATGGGDPWVDLVTVDLTNPALDTLGKLVSYLDSIADVTCTLAGDQNEPVADLDAVSNQDVKTALYTATANIGAIVYWINSTSQLCTASRVASAVNAPANVAYTFLAGGSEGAAPSNNDWQAAINAFATEDISFLFVCSDSETIHAMALAHCTAQSDVKTRKERVTILGGAANETVDQVIARAQALADKRSVLCYPGIKRRNLTTGTLDTLSPMYGAALVCGMAAGVTPETPLTFKAIRAAGLEKTLSLTDLESLLLYGVLPFEAVPTGGFRIVQGLTTYLVDGNVVWRKLAGVRIADYLNRELRASVERFVGGVADESTVLSILNAAASKLRQLTRSRSNPTGVLTAGVNPDTGAAEPAFKNLKAVFDGFDLVAITYEAHPVGEVAYITVTAGLTPTTIVVKQ